MESKVTKSTFNCIALSVSLLGNGVSIKQILQQQLKATIDFSGMDIATAEQMGGVELTPEKIPLHRLSDDTGIFYRCAIAFKLSSLWKMPALDIANQLLVSFPTINQENASQTYLDFKVEVVSPGWINLRLSNRGLATWLQHLSQIPSSTPVDNEVSFQDSQNLFPVQYAHARCCSLLRSAHQQGLIKLKQGGVEANPIPWLNDDQETLRLVHPAERYLIEQILDVQDTLDGQSQHSYVKLAIALSQAFEKFYSSCRIWGEVKTETPKLAQARLGLVAVTQGLLRDILEEQLAIAAPREL